MAPASARDILPPLCGVAQIHWVGLALKDKGARHEQVGIGVGIGGGIEGAFSHGDVPRLRDETRELGGGDGVRIHPEAVHRHMVRRRLFGVVLVRSHQERPTWNPHHARLWWLRLQYLVVFHRRPPRSTRPVR